MVGIKNKSGRNKGCISPNKGKKFSEEHKQKIRESCINAPVIHHINGNHFDDRPENRMVVTPREHAKIHIIQGDIVPYGKKLNNRRLKCQTK